MATILPFRTSTYALSIYRFGTNRLTARDGCTGVADGYYTPIEQYAATNFYRAEFDIALDNGWINEQEYNETLAFIPTPVTPAPTSSDVTPSALDSTNTTQES
jgi:hypothetical protein